MSRWFTSRDPGPDACDTDPVSAVSPPPRPLVHVEVTNTLAFPFTTGIQRVVREVVAGLQGPAGDGIDVVPVVQDAAGAPYRPLHASETAALAEHPAGGGPGRRADRFGRLAPAVRRIGDLSVTIRARQAATELWARRRLLVPGGSDRSVEGLEPGSLFLDLEGSWFDPSPRDRLLPLLVDAGVRPVAFVHDLMAVTHPEWFDPTHVRVYRRWIDAHLEHSAAFLANSHCTAADLVEVGRRDGHAAPLEVSVVPLGSDPTGDGPPRRPSALQALSDSARMLLVVGTLEPRKNQGVALDAFDRLRAQGDDVALVLVGKQGWMIDTLVDRIRDHPALGSSLFWLSGIDEAELTWCYRNAFVAIAPSLYEGLGVPVLEALGHGCATLVSTGGAQPEAGGDAVELFDPADVDGLVGLVRQHLDDDAHHIGAVARARAHHPPTWEDSATAIAAALRSVAERPLGSSSRTRPT